MKEKRCNHCGEVKPLSGFRRRSDRPQQVESQCTQCRNDYARTNAARKRKIDRPAIRRCTTCLVIHSGTDFYVDTKREDGLDDLCKTCRREVTKKAAIPLEGEKRCNGCQTVKLLSEFYRKWHKKGTPTSLCKVCHTAETKSRQGTINRKTTVRKSRLKSNYGLSVEDYESLLDQYNRQCAVCQSTERLVVDHCHITGRIRGILCNRCNIALGKAKDSPNIIRKAIVYLLKARG